jgi:hypothetical protein
MLQHRLAPRRILQLLLMLRDLLAACRTAGVRDSRPGPDDGSHGR